MTPAHQRQTVLRIVFIVCVLALHAATMALLDTKDVVGLALAVHRESANTVIVGLFVFLLLRVFVWIFVPGFVLFWLAEGALRLVASRRARAA